MQKIKVELVSCRKAPEKRQRAVKKSFQSVQDGFENVFSDGMIAGVFKMIEVK